MAKRVAFFTGKEDVENFFNMRSKRENLFESHYNLSPGHHIPIIFKKEGETAIERIRWGDESTHEAVLTSRQAIEEVSGKNVFRCAVPLSGFYVWKDDQEQGSPFFVRMLNSPLMVAAGLYYRDQEFFKLVTASANVLVKPMSKTMPLLLDRNLALRWIDKEQESDIEELIEKAGSLFLFTDLSVLRVSKKVNDPASNSEKLVQPIPK